MLNGPATFLRCVTLVLWPTPRMPSKLKTKSFAKEFWAYFSKHIENGTLRSLPVELYIALILGPCQEFVRYWLSRPVNTELDTAGAEIAGAAWQALRVKELNDAAFEDGRAV